MYDSKEIKKIVKEKRKNFYIKTSLILCIMVTSLVLSLTGINDTLTVLGIVAEFPLFYLLVKTCNKSEAKVLLKGEIKGKNIKEIEYGIQNDGQPPIYRRGNMPHNMSNRKVHPRRLNGSVYLELKNGNIKEITSLYESHMNIYEEGDILLKYAGTKYPVVISRQSNKLPCPICGEVNNMSQDFCQNCGLGIIKNDKGNLL